MRWCVGSNDTVAEAEMVVEKKNRREIKKERFPVHEPFWWLLAPVF